MAFIRFQNMNPARPKCCDILLRRRIFIHDRIHGRSHIYRRFCGQQRRCQHIIRNPRSRLGQKIGRRRYDENQICQCCQSHMFHLKMRDLAPHVQRDGLTADFTEGQLGNKLRCLPGHDHMNLRPGFAQTAHHFHRFIGCNAARNAYDNLFTA